VGEGVIFPVRKIGRRGGGERSTRKGEGTFVKKGKNDRAWRTVLGGGGNCTWFEGEKEREIKEKKY